MPPIQSFTGLRNTFGTPGAYLVICFITAGLLIVPLLIGAVFFLALKFLMWSILSFASLL